MSGPSVSTMRLYTRGEFDPATELLCAINEVVRVEVRRKDDGSHEMVVIAPVGAQWLEEATARSVIWLKAGGSTTEWMVAKKVDSLDSPEVAVICDPYHRILADFGVMEHVATPGGMPKQNLGGLNGTIENYLETYARPAMEERDVDFIVPGDTSAFPSETFSYSFAGQTILAMVARLAKDANGKWELSRNEGDERYEIDALSEFPGSTVWATEGRNLLQLVRELDREDLRTAIRPIGDLASGEEERANIGFNSHPAVAVSTDTLTLGKHGHEDDATLGPIWEDNQFAPVVVNAVTVYPGCYLENQAGTRKEIVSTSAPRTVVVEAGGGASFAVGDDVSIVRNSDGTLLTELASPSGIVSARGIVQGPVQLPYTGHRNWIRNPNWMKWDADAPPQVVNCLVNGAHSGVTSFVLDGLSAGFVIEEGDALLIGNGLTLDRITADVTADGGGNATVAIATARTAADNSRVAICRQYNRGPKYWSRLPAEAGIATPLRSARVAVGTLAPLANGAQTATFSVVMDGFTAGTVISPGFLLDAAGGGKSWIIEGATADGGGNATVVVLQAITVTNNQVLAIYKPDLGAGSGYVVGQFPSLIAGTAGAAMLSQDFTVRYVPGITNRLWLKVDYVAMAQNVSGWAASSGTARPPRIIIADSAGIELSGANASDWGPSGPGACLSEVLTVTRDILVTTTLKARIRWPYDSALDGGASHPWMDLRAVQVHLGMSSDLAFVEGSGANRLFYDGQVVLAAHCQWPAIYTATTTELGIPADAIDIGTTLRMGSPTMSVSALMLRVVGLSFNPFDLTPEGNIREKRLVLGTAPEYFTDQVGRVSMAPTLYVNIDVPSAPARQTVIASTDPPLEVSGAMRFRVAAGTIASGAVAVEAYET